MIRQEGSKAAGVFPGQDSDGTGIKASRSGTGRENPEKEKEDGIGSVPDASCLPGSSRSQSFLGKIERIIGPEDFSDGLYKDGSALMVFEQHEKGKYESSPDPRISFDRGERNSTGRWQRFFNASLSESLET